MIILGIETSCDETACAILEKTGDRIQILSNVVASSADLQAKYGGVIPEQAAREQIKSIIPVIDEALSQAFPDYTLDPKPYTLIDAIAVTYGPGLIGSLLVGVETAKTLAVIWKKPIIPINHLIGHFYANWISNTPSFPALGLLVSGGHTDLVLFTNHNEYEYLGGTRDDAAGECFDKCARLLGLPYPGGPQLSSLAQKGDPTKFKLPVPMTDSHDLDFSYSGLKTSVSNIVHGLSEKNNDKRLTITDKQNLAAAIENTIVKSLINKATAALKQYPVKDVIVAGGVTANEKLASELKLEIRNLKLEINLHIPPPDLCTDNGVMIASAGFFYKPTEDIFSVEADPSLALSS